MHVTGRTESSMARPGVRRRVRRARLVGRRPARCSMPRRAKAWGSIRVIGNTPRGQKPRLQPLSAGKEETWYRAYLTGSPPRGTQTRMRPRKLEPAYSDPQAGTARVGSFEVQGLSFTLSGFRGGAFVSAGRGPVPAAPSTRKSLGRRVPQLHRLFPHSVL